MKKVVPVLLILIATVYTVVWWNQAGRFKDEVTRFAQKGGISYESVSRKGFPFHFMVEVKNPKIDLTGESLHGTVSVGTDLFAKEGKLILNGEWLGAQKIRGNLTITKPDFLQALQKRKDGSDSILDWVNDLSIQSDGLDLSIGENIHYEFGKSDIQLHTEKSGEKDFQSSIALNLTDFFSGDLFANREDAKGDIRCKISATFPPFFEEPTFLPFTFAIEEFVSTTNYGKGFIQGHLSVQTFDSEWQGRLIFSSSQRFSKLFPKMERDKLFVHLEPLFSLSPTVRSIFQNDYEKLALLAPDFPNMGDIESEIDLEISGPLANPYQLTQINVKKCNLLCDRYGIEMSGEAGTNQAQFALNLNHHRDLLSDVVDYYNKARELLFPNLPALNHKISEKAACFLDSLSESPDKDRLHLAIKSDASQHLSIGSKSDEALQIALMTFAADIVGELQ